MQLKSIDQNVVADFFQAMDIELGRFDAAKRTV